MEGEVCNAPGVCNHAALMRRAKCNGTLDAAYSRMQVLRKKNIHRNTEQKVVCSGSGSSNDIPCCPWSLNCFWCLCLDCDFAVCLSTGGTIDIFRQHFPETGHRLGICAKNGTFITHLCCFKCSDLIDIVIVLEDTPNNLTTLSLGQSNGSKQGNSSNKATPKTVPTTRRDHSFKNCRGLFNFGKTCYMNCILQVLFHISQFSDYLTVKMADQLLPRADRQSRKDNIDLIAAFYKLFLKFCKEDPLPIVPNDFVYAVWQHYPTVGGNNQHDAHEFLTTILNALHQDFIQGCDYEPKTKSIIDQIFLGRLQSEVNCKVCKHSRFTNDPFWDISLEVVSEKPSGIPIKLTELLARYTHIEQLGTANLLQCTICGRRTQSSKQLKFLSVPNIVCIQLKRFRHNRRNVTWSCCTKLKAKIEVPEIIDFAPYIVKPDEGLDETWKNAAAKRPRVENKDELYRLHSIVSHNGTYNSGHYRTYVCFPFSWLCFDDEKVYKVTKEHVMGSEGYLLFYKRTNGIRVVD